jgi:hypothetical protein
MSISRQGPSYPGWKLVLFLGVVPLALAFARGGVDFLVGGLGIDSIYGDGAADRLYARDGGPDKAIDCGSVIPGDVALTDPRDPAARACRELGSGRE